MRLLPYRFWPAFLLLALAAGCFPATYVTVPAIRGRVVDAASRPVAGATVELVPQRGKATPTPVVTALDGTFCRLEDSNFFFYIAPMDFAPFPTYSVVVSSAGRRWPTTRVSVGTRIMGAGLPSSGRDLGDLRLP